MPIYDYQCSTCQRQFTVQARMNDPEPTQGPHCQQQSCSIKKSLSRVFGQVAGAHAAPIETPASKPKESPSHVCSKYCDLHK